MSLIDRYIFKTVVTTALISLLVLLALETFFTLMGEIEDMGEGNYGLPQVLQYLLLTLPRRTYEIFPMCLLVGGLLGMGSLASSSELVAMRAAGASLFRLVGAALKAGLFLGVLSLILGEFIAPYAEQIAQESRANARNQSIDIRHGLGFWARDGQNFVNVRAVLPSGRLANIYIYEMGESSELKSVIYARNADYVEGRWALQGVARTLIQPEAVYNRGVDNLLVDSVISPAMLNVLASDPEDLSIRDLRTYITYLNRNGLEDNMYQLAFWSKVLGPLTNLAMLFIAMPFVFGSQRKAGAGQRLLIGVFLGLLFFLANRMLGNLVLLYGYHPLLGAGSPMLLFFAAGAYALHKVR